MDYYVRRALAAVCSLSAVSILLIFRIYSISADSQYVSEVLAGQYTRKNTVMERSGFVYDTNGKLLSHELVGGIAIVNPKTDGDKSAVLGYLTDNSAHSLDMLVELYKKGEPFTVSLNGIPKKQTPEGIYVYPDYKSDSASICRHILGYRSSDGEGMSGIYKSYDSLLDCISGSVSYKYTANALGGVMDGGSFYIEDIGYTGRDGLVLTTDKELQRRIDGICDEKMYMGAVLISELSTGNILALSSRPVYDIEDVGRYLNSPDGEFINRAFSLYTPGSVFKAVVAAAALEKDQSLYLFEYECTGECDVSGQIFRCHDKDGHGVQTMKEAFANSCNTYFIQLVRQTGFENILVFCNRTGLGKASIIDGFFINGARMPSLGKSYPDAYKANFAFGQGDLLMSCVDVMKVYGICSTGMSRELSIVKGLYGKTEEEDVIFERSAAERVLSQDTVVKMREMMRLCITDGTGKGAQIEMTEAGGKTATAQSGQYKNGREVLHTWFAGVFPIDNPKYAVVVLCDGNGESNASPKEIFALCAKSVLEICDN